VPIRALGLCQRHADADPRCAASLIVPFPDEPNKVIVLDYQPHWPAEFERIAGRLTAALSNISLAIDHVGSTSVPGLAAKDCIDQGPATNVLMRAVEQRAGRTN
jgi:GrpB protein